jgi:Transmembrane domain of unknown function (DUF3566)
MTETQAKSGAAGTSTSPVDNEAADAADAGANGANAAGRSVVGRASVPADGSAPKFTRAPGMAPPPDTPPADGSEPEHTAPVASGYDGSGPDARPADGGPSGGGSGTATQVAGSGAPSVSTGRASVPPGARISPTVAVGGPFGAGSSAGAPPIVPSGRGTATAVGAGAAGAAAAAAPGPARRTMPGSGRVADAVRAARATVSSAASRGPRRARLFVKRIDPWSVMKFSFAVAFVLFFVAIVATAVLYLALDAMGVWDSVNKALADMIGANGSKSTFKVTALGVIGTAGVLGLVNVVLFTALATLSAFIYNVCADLVGGIEVTLSEKD